MNPPATRIIVQMEGQYSSFPAGATVTHDAGVTHVASDGSTFSFGTAVAPADTPAPVVAAAPVAPAVSAPADDVLSLELSGTSYHGVGAEAVVTVNGVEVLREIETTDHVDTITGKFGADPTITLSFDNDAAGIGLDGVTKEDRNLTVTNVTYDGKPVQGLGGWLYRDVTQTTSNVSAPPPPAAPAFAPAAVEATRPDRIQGKGRIPATLTPVGNADVLAMVGPGQAFAGIGDAYLAAAADPTRRWCIRVLPGDYAGGMASTPTRNYLRAAATLEGADPLNPPRITPGAWGAENAKGLYCPAVAGLHVFRNLELFHSQDPYPGHRGNEGLIAPEGGVPGMAIEIDGVLAYLSNNAFCRGGEDTDWTISGTEVTECGLSGDGYSHNLYLLGRSATITNLTSTRASQGHAFKSRCATTTITDSRFDDLDTGTASYLLDFPDGGVVKLVRVMARKGAHASNHAIVHFGQEKFSGYHAVSSLTTQDLTLLSDDPIAVGVRVKAPLVQPDAPDPALPMPPAPVVVMTGTKYRGLARLYDGWGDEPCPDTAAVLLP